MDYKIQAFKKCKTFFYMFNLYFLHRMYSFLIYRFYVIVPCQIMVSQNKIELNKYLRLFKALKTSFQILRLFKTL